jgi:hypothetical protein
MSNLEQYQYFDTKDKIGNQEMIESKRLIICVDDEPGFSERFAESFVDLPDVACFTPVKVSRKQEKLTPQRLSIFFNSFTEEQLSRVDAVFIDQFFDQKSIYKDLSRNFIQRLRKVNESAWILETSGNPMGQAYPGSNAMIEVVAALDGANLIEDAGNTLPVRLYALRHYSYEEFIAAQMAMLAAEPDPEADAVLGTPEEIGYRSLARNDWFKKGLSIIKRSEETSAQLFKQLAAEDRRLFLHHFWNLLGHLHIESEESTYSTAAQRLNEFFEPSDAT